MKINGVASAEKSEDNQNRILNGKITVAEAELDVRAARCRKRETERAP